MRLCLFTLVILLSASSATGQSLLFSEYIEGSSNNKALEIYNATGSTIDLSDYQVLVYFNGSTEPGLTLEPVGTLAASATYVIGHSSADQAILDVADHRQGGGWFNGNDAVVLTSGDNPTLHLDGQEAFQMPRTCFASRTSEKRARHLSEGPVVAAPDPAHLPRDDDALFLSTDEFLFDFNLGAVFETAAFEEQ